MSSTVWTAIVLAGMTPLHAVGDWPGFRGLNGSGVADAGKYPTELHPEKNLVWKMPIRPGKSSPIVIGGRIFLTAHEGDNRFVLCHDVETGKELWKAGLTVDRSEARHELNDAAAPTVASDGERVFAFFADFGLIAYSIDGKELWRQLLGPFTTLHGMASSPIYSGGKLFLLADQSFGSYLTALDPESGETLWRTERPDVSGSQATPVIYNDEIITLGPSRIVAYGVESGQERWRFTGLPFLPKALPVVAQEMLYVAHGSGGQSQPPVYDNMIRSFDKNGNKLLELEELPAALRGLFESADTDGSGEVSKSELEEMVRLEVSGAGMRAVRLGGRGDVTATHLAWNYSRSIPSVPSPLIYNGIAYFVRDGGILTALDAVSGKLLKQGRLRDAIDHYYASPIAGDGKIYTLSESGKVSIISAGGNWEVLENLDLSEDVYATPALSHDSIFVRTMSSLYRFGAP